MIEIGSQRFEALVADALDAVPPELAAMMDNIAVVVDHEEHGDLLGLYEGVPLTERDAYGGFAMPDRITIFRRALCASVDTEADLVDEVTITVIHEVAHHFGIDDDALEELGWA